MDKKNNNNQIGNYIKTKGNRISNLGLQIIKSSVGEYNILEIIHAQSERYKEKKIQLEKGKKQ